MRFAKVSTKAAGGRAGSQASKQATAAITISVVIMMSQSPTALRLHSLRS